MNVGFVEDLHDAVSIIVTSGNEISCWLNEIENNYRLALIDCLSKVA